MIVTIESPTTGLKRAGMWQAEVMMGLEIENHFGNTFEVIVHDQKKLDNILLKCSGRVIATKHRE